MDIKRRLRKSLTEGDKKLSVNLDKLKDVAEGISKICLGEYGYTWYHPEENKIAICLGDANPFGDWEELEDWIRWGCIEGSHEDITNFDIEVDGEWGPTGDGWLKYN